MQVAPPASDPPPLFGLASTTSIAPFSPDTSGFDDGAPSSDTSGAAPGTAATSNPPAGLSSTTMTALLQASQDNAGAAPSPSGVSADLAATIVNPWKVDTPYADVTGIYSSDARAGLPANGDQHVVPFSLTPQDVSLVEATLGVKVVFLPLMIGGYDSAQITLLDAKTGQVVTNDNTLRQYTVMTGLMSRANLNGSLPGGLTDSFLQDMFATMNADFVQAGLPTASPSELEAARQWLARQSAGQSAGATG